MRRGARASRKTLHVLRVFAPAALADQLGELLLLAGARGVAHEEHGEATAIVVYGEERRRLDALARTVTRALGAHGLMLRTEVRAEGRDSSAWKGAPGLPEPVRVSRSLSLVPAGPVALCGPGSLVLGRAFAFGFGDHPTTRMAAREVERQCAKGAVSSMLDIGTGTGVLALVAALRGVPDVLGIDTDADAVKAARQNARSNGVAARCAFRKGTAGRIRRRFDLVAANLDYRTLLPLLPMTGRLVTPSGTLVVTGFLTRDARDVVEVAGNAGFVKARERREGGFSVLVMARRGRAGAGARAGARAGASAGGGATGSPAPGLTRGTR